MKIKSIWALAFLCALCGFSASAQNVPSKWLFGKAYASQMAAAWEDAHSLDATSSGEGIMTAVRADGSEMERYVIIQGRAAAGPFRGGDSFQFDVPAKGMSQGSFVSFDATFSAEPGAPTEWIVEWKDGDSWVSGRKYRCHGAAYGKQHRYTTVHQTFRLKSAVEGDVLKVRLKALDSASIPAMDGHEETGLAMFIVAPHIGAQVCDFGQVSPKDTTKVLCIGNSFTYCHSCPLMLKELAWGEGHYLDMSASLKGGWNMEKHLVLATTHDAVRAGGYDVVILQDQSQGPARVGYDRKANVSQVESMVKMADMARSTSPGCRIVIECTWAYPGKDNGGFESIEHFYNYAGKGAKIMAKAVGNAEVSPIRDAFRIAALERPDIMLFSTDAFHQSEYGSYLKSCVNYLLIFGEPFGNSPADCGLDPSKTVSLRRIAERVVL